MTRSSLLVFILCLVAVSLPVLGQDSPGTRPSGGPLSPDGRERGPVRPPPLGLMRPAPLTLPEMAREYVMAQAEVARAEARLSDARNQWAETKRQLNASADDSPELREARRRIDAAYAAYEAARRPVLERVRAMNEYRQAMREHDRVSRELEQAKRTGKEGQVVPLAKAKMRFGSTARTMERMALERDAAVAEAKQNLVASNRAVARQREQLAGRVEEDSRFREATLAVEQAANRLFDAQAREAASGAAYAQALGMYDDAYYLRKQRGAPYDLYISSSGRRGRFVY